MKHTSCILGISLLALSSGSANAMESATVGNQATQSTVSVLNSKIDALAAQLQASNNCTAQRKFYAPADAKKDANGCVGVGDYDINMATTSNINLANGRVYSTQGAANNWGGLFYGPSNYGGVYGQAGIYGVYGYATGNGYGVIGNATANSGGIGGQFNGGNSGVRAYGGVYGLVGSASTAGAIGVRGDAPASNAWGGYFTGAYGVYGQSTSNGWGGEFVAPNYGVYGSGATYGVYSNGPLCIYGSCITSWSQVGGSRFGGAYTWNTDGWCSTRNPQTGGCSCLSGYGSYSMGGFFGHNNLYICQK